MSLIKNDADGKYTGKYVQRHICNLFSNKNDRVPVYPTKRTKTQTNKLMVLNAVRGEQEETSLIYGQAA